jgi:hypothetical protein
MVKPSGRPIPERSAARPLSVLSIVQRVIGRNPGVLDVTDGTKLRVLTAEGLNVVSAYGEVL